MNTHIFITECLLQHRSRGDFVSFASYACISSISLLFINPEFIQKFRNKKFYFVCSHETYAVKLNNKKIALRISGLSSEFVNNKEIFEMTHIYANNENGFISTRYKIFQVRTILKFSYGNHPPQYLSFVHS